MDPVSAIASNAGLTPTASTNGFADLESQDFFKLLITQITTQDPLEPTDNDALLRQISSIRDIELNTELTESLRTLTGQQGMGSASALIGQHITSLPGEDGVSQSGIVVGVKFAPGGQPVLILSSGAELPMAKVSTVVPPLQAAEALIGSTVQGVDRRDPKSPKEVEGVVAGATVENGGEVILELDTGESIRLRDVTAAIPLSA